MVHKEVIHPVNSLHGSQGSNILLSTVKGSNTPVNSLHGSQGSNISC